jgi:hypothetical protein
MWYLVVLVGLVGLAPLGSARGQASSTSGESLVIKGVAADAKGPLGGKVVLIMPIINKFGSQLEVPVIRHLGVSATFGTERSRDAATGKWTFRYKDEPDDDRTGKRLNPQTTTDARGAFSVAVPHTLFIEAPGCAYNCSTFKTGALGIAVFDGLVSAFEVKVINYDPSASTVDAGRVVFEPAREPPE